MNLQLIRYHSGDDATLGSLFHVPPGGSPSWLCYTLEDEHRDQKVLHETRIPAGSYRLDLRTEGQMTQKYSRSFRGIHEGMIWLRWKHDGGDLGYIEDWGFKYVYFHVGNHQEQTSGCPLLGLAQNSKAWTVTHSRDAYRAVYPAIAGAIADGETTELQVVDFA